MDESAGKPTPPRGPRLVQQDIELSRETRDGQPRVVARVECVRRGCGMEVEQCARCAHFARIETHEAGYVLLCRVAEEGDGQAAQEDDEPL